jgi:membrane dipeptidase
MTRFRRSLLPCLLLAAVSATAQSSSPSGPTVSARARAIQESAIVVDTHADTPQRFLDEGFDIGSTDPNDIGHISLDKAGAGIWARSFFPSGSIPKPIKATSRSIRSI